MGSFLNRSPVALAFDYLQRSQDSELIPPIGRATREGVGSAKNLLLHAECAIYNLYSMSLAVEWREGDDERSPTARRYT